MRRKYIKLSLLLFLLGIVSVNALAFMHAKAMTEFTSISSRTGSPEDLDFVSKAKVLLTGVKIPRPENNQTPEDVGLSFKEHRFMGAKRSTLEAWHIPFADSDILVLLFHGYSASKESLLPIARQLNSLGLSTFSVDFYGSGGSNGSGTTIGYLEAIDVNATFEYAKANWPNSKIILYGQSMGGVAILRSIAEYKTKPDAVVIESTYDKMLSTVKNRFTSMGVPSMPLAELLVFWGGWQSGFNAFGHNPTEYAKTVSCPTLVIHGELDPRVTSDQAKEVYDQLDSWKFYSTYPAAGHLAAMDSDLIQWRSDIGLIVDKLGE